MSDERQELEQKINLKFIRPSMNYRNIPSYAPSGQQETRPFISSNAPRSKIENLPRASPSPYHSSDNDYSSQPQIIIQNPVPSCIDVHNHTKKCIVCLKLYKHNDTIYLVIILILICGIIFLMKKKSV